MAQVLQQNCTSNAADVDADLTSSPYAGPYSELWVEFDVAFNSTFLTTLVGQAFSETIATITDGSGNIQEVDIWRQSGHPVWTAFPAPTGVGYYDPASTVIAGQFYHVKMHVTAGSPITSEIWIDGVSIGTIDTTGVNMVDLEGFRFNASGVTSSGGLIYIDNAQVGTTDGASDVLVDDFEETPPNPDATIWNSFVSSDSTLTDGSGILPPVTPPVVGRVLVAFDDGPLEPTPAWTRLDGGDSPFPQNFVSGYDIQTGRQTLISQTDTGTATVYINDRDGLFDDRNLSSPFVGKLSGKQILLQLYDPVRAAWEEQFRGLIDDYTYDIDGSAVNAAGEPINASIQLECVDVFDYLAGYGLTPGLDGVTAPAGSQATIYYAETSGSVQDRVIEVMADVGIDTSMYIAASGNVKVQAAKYDPDEPALNVLRDCADAELPFIANIYVNRHGQFCFRGRYSRFYPDDVSAEPGSRWDFNRWAVGDGPAIQSDPTRAQMRVLSYSRSRQNIINAAIAYPQGIEDADMPGQVFANTSSITAYGKHTPPGPMSNLLTLSGTVTMNDANTETALYAELLVKNQKDPRVTVTALQLKSIATTDPRSSVTWALITQADISDIVNVAVGYPGGTGFTGDSPQDDYYIEGRHMTVRPANTGYDQVELDFEVSAAVWSMDTNTVFPNPFA